MIVVFLLAGVAAAEKQVDQAVKAAKAEGLKEQQDQQTTMHKQILEEAVVVEIRIPLEVMADLASLS